MPFLNRLGRAQNKNVLKPIFLYGSSLSVLPKVMNHLVNQTGILWFLICLPLISWVACRDLIWDCLPFLYGSMEGQYGEWWARAGTFSCCSTRSCATKGKVDNPHLFSSLLFYSTLFWASFPGLLPLVFPPPILRFNCFHPAYRGGCEGREGVRGGGLQTPSKWLQQLEGCHAALMLALLPMGRTGVCQDRSVPAPRWSSVLPGPNWDTAEAGVNPLPSTAPVAAACCRGAELRSWRQWHFKRCRCLLSGCESV